jgi:hypothetical protein
MSGRLTKEEQRRSRPAGNFPPYVRACLRRGLRFRAAALAVSVLAAAFFAVAWWWGVGHGSLAGSVPLKAGLACAAQVVITVFLALELRAAQREQEES